MARDISASMLAALATGSVRPILFYEGEFSGGTVRLFNGHGTISWDGETWTGDAGMMRVSALSDSADLQAVNFTVGLAGEVSSLVSIALAQVRRGLPGSLWLGFLDASNAVIADPILCFKGRADRPEIIPDPSASEITVGYESRLIDATRRRERRFTAQDQKIDYPTDTGFDNVAALQDKLIVWGRSASRGTNSPALGGPVDSGGAGWDAGNFSGGP